MLTHTDISYHKRSKHDEFDLVKRLLLGRSCCASDRTAAYIAIRMHSLHQQPGLHRVSGTTESSNIVNGYVRYACLWLSPNVCDDFPL